MNPIQIQKDLFISTKRSNSIHSSFKCELLLFKHNFIACTMPRTGGTVTGATVNFCLNDIFIRRYFLLSNSY